MHQVLSLGRNPLWKKQALTFLAGFLALWPVASEAIDCTLAKTPTELAICADPALVKLDAQLNRDYKAFRDAYQKSDNHQCLLEDEAARQKAWLKDRDACGNDAICIFNAYQSRIEKLEIYSKTCVIGDCLGPNLGRTCAQHCNSTPVANPTTPTTSTPVTAPATSSCEKISPTDDKKAIEEYNKSNLILSENGRSFIKAEEGEALCLYEDYKGFATIGYGHLVMYDKNGNHAHVRELPTRAPAEFERFRNGISLQEANNILTEDVNKKINEVKGFIKVKLTQCQMDALIDLIFQSGAGNKRKLYTAINSCKFDEAAKLIKNLKFEPDRRNREYNVFTACNYGSKKMGKVPCCTYTYAHDYPTARKGSTYQAGCRDKPTYMKGKVLFPRCDRGGTCYGDF